MGELKTEYEGRITFTITHASSPEGQAAAEKYVFGGARHGMVGLDKNGSAEIVWPGHNYDKELIEDELATLLE